MIKLRNIEASDLENYEYWNLPVHKYHTLNGPYFKKKTNQEIQDFIKHIKSKFEDGIINPLPQKKIISNKANEMIGEVSWSWRSKETLWMEIGIVIFDEQHWGKGIGYLAMKLWISELFETKKKIIRLGLTTWSGNTGMIRLAEKLNMKKEANYRKARIVNEEYYDSISFGMLREEWNATKGDIGDNEKSILDELTKSFFSVFTNKDGRSPDWNLIYQVCIPEAIIIKKADAVQEVYNLESFINPRMVLLSNGTLLEFEEQEEKEETQIIGNLAQRFSIYSKNGILNGIRFEQSGNKLFQFVKTNEGWKINSVIWEDH